RAAESLRPLVDFALGQGLGQLPEIFDGDAPHRAAGCFAQAWSVAQVIQSVAAIGDLV
ncbi:MAG: amylo-alpha-1,6-glucosidase, partial [Thermoanaerobaculia bacterium]